VILKFLLGTKRGIEKKGMKRRRRRAQQPYNDERIPRHASSCHRRPAGRKLRPPASPEKCDSKNGRREERGNRNRELDVVKTQQEGEEIDDRRPGTRGGGTTKQRTDDAKEKPFRSNTTRHRYEA